MESERYGAKDFAGCITNLNVAINGLGNPDNLNTVIVEFLGHKGRIGVGIVSSDDNHGIQAQGFAGFPGKDHFFWRVNLGPAGFDHAKPTQIQILPDTFLCKFHSPVFNDPIRTH